MTCEVLEYLLKSLMWPNLENQIHRKPYENFGNDTFQYTNYIYKMKYKVSDSV